MHDFTTEERLEKNWKEWFLVINGFYYFMQGVAIVAIIVLQILMIDKFGLTPTEALANYGTIMLPWGLKFIYGLVSDNFSLGKLGRRRPYIILAGLVGLVGWIWIPLFDSFSSLFMIVAVGLSLTVAISDAILDSLAVDITPQKRRGAMQGVGWGFRGAGSALAGFLFGIATNRGAWEYVYIIPGILLAVSCFAVIFYPEPKPKDMDKVVMTEWSDYKSAIVNKNTWIVTAFMILSGTGITVVAVFTSFLKAETSLELDMVGIGITIFALGQFFGAVLVGLSGDRLPLFPVLAITTAIYTGILGLMFFIAGSSTFVIYVIVFFIGAINGGYEATQMRIGMEHSVGKVSGSVYNWFMSISNLGQLTLGAWLIADLAENPSIGFPIGMQFASAFLLLALIPGWFAIKSIKNYQKEGK